MKNICVKRWLLQRKRQITVKYRVGAVIVKDDIIIGRGYNRRESDKNAVLHAEIVAISNACQTVKSWRLNNATLYVTLEPCSMCAGAIINSRIENVVYGAFDKRFGCCGSVINLFDFDFNHRPKIITGVLENECSDLLKRFFEDLRK